MLGMMLGNWISGIKKPPFGGFIFYCITLYLLDFIPWYPERDLNPHSQKPRDFKSLVSTDFTTRARENWRRVPESNRTRRICNPLHNRFVNAP
jgi:hypothetical protein